MALLASSRLQGRALAASSRAPVVPVAPSRVSRSVGSSRRVQAASEGAVPVDQLTGIAFLPFNEVQPELATVDKANASVDSFARTHYADACEAAINEQINIEYNISYVYHSLYAYFDRDNVGLPGLAKYFKDGSDEEREHAELLMAYQNKRGGRVRLGSIMQPEAEFNHAEKGDALYAMELALSLEKLNFVKLRELHDVAVNANDAQMCDFIESQLLADQVEAIKQVATYVSQLRRVGKGLGVFEFDKYLGLEQGAGAA